MDAVIGAKTGYSVISGSSHGGAAEGANSRVWFGGSYVERWSKNYTLLISYRDRKQVDARYDGDVWRPVGGDAEMCERLLCTAPQDFLSRYFQAAAEAWFAAHSCLDSGQPLSRLHERFPAGCDPLTAAEMLRLLMDDCGLKLETALPLVLHCCPDYALCETELEQLLPLQPRTAHVAELLRSNPEGTVAAVHDARRAEYRLPFGALRCGEELTLRVRVLCGTVSAAELLVWGDEFRQTLPMTRGEGDWFCRFDAPTDPAALWYAFRMQTEAGERWLCAESNGWSSELRDKPGEGFRLTVYRADFDTPAWFRRSVMYQIFPDRFAFSGDDTARRGIDYHRALGQTPELHRSIREAVRWQPRPFERDYTPDDFYGGTLKGVEQKLPYLKALGVSVLYLNPIVEARSNHRYDTSDYHKVDPILGTNEDFTHLCREAERFGIRVMLDGVFSHTGADSVYFNRYGNYPGRGACQGRDSAFYDWYEFRRFPGDYRCWWGFKDLPEVDERNENWQDYVISGKNSVVREWLRRGAAGWRLDVADELPDEVLALIRRAVKEEKPDAPILGEVWEDAVLKESYGSRRRYALGESLDSVMNYPFRSAVLDFIHGRSSAYGLRDFLIGQQLNYPKPLYYSLMNLLGSHDVDRIRTALSAPTTLRALSRVEQLNYPFREEDLALALDRERLCAALQFAIPGVPSIYYGDEQGMWGTGDPFNRAPFTEGDAELHDEYAALAARRNENPCLRTGEAVFAACSSEVLTVLRYVNHGADAFGDPAPDGAWLLIINRSGSEQLWQADAAAAGCGLLSGRIGPLRAEWRQLRI